MGMFDGEKALQTVAKGGRNRCWRWRCRMPRLWSKREAALQVVGWWAGGCWWGAAGSRVPLLLLHTIVQWILVMPACWLAYTDTTAAAWAKVERLVSDANLPSVCLNPFFYTTVGKNILFKIRQPAGYVLLPRVLYSCFIAIYYFHLAGSYNLCLACYGIRHNLDRLHCLQIHCAASHHRISILPAICARRRIAVSPVDWPELD
jgi:hypothetical protein